MQPLAVAALAVGVIMLAGASATLIWTRRDTRPLPGGMNRWQLHGCIPLGGAGLVLGVLSREGSGQTPATHQVLFATASTLLVGALLCGVAGAVSGMRQQRAARQ